jgi:hypothetical protein
MYVKYLLSQEGFLTEGYGYLEFESDHTYRGDLEAIACPAK